MFSTWAPKALAGIGIKCLQPATRTRCIVIELERAADGTDYEPLSEVDTIENPWLDLARRLARWAADFPRAAGGNVDMEGLSRRTADNWRPLYAIAEALAGDWPELAKDASKELSAAKRVSDEEEKTMLLSDLRDIFGDQERMHSKDIVEALAAFEDRPWAEWGGRTSRCRRRRSRAYSATSRSPRRWRCGSARRTARATSAAGCNPCSSAISRRRGMTKRHNVTTRIRTGKTAKTQPSHLISM